MSGESSPFEQYVAEPTERLLWFLLKFVVEVAILVGLALFVGALIHRFFEIPASIDDHELLRDLLDVGFIGPCLDA